MPNDFVGKQEEFVLLGGFPDTVTSCPVEDLWLDSELFKGQVRLAVVDKLPIEGVDVILANDLVSVKRAGTSSVVNPLLSLRPNSNVDADRKLAIAAVTRGKKKELEIGQSFSNLGDLFSTKALVGDADLEEKVLGTEVREGEKILWDLNSLIQEQNKDSSLSRLREKVVGNWEEDYSRPCFKLRDKVLVRVSRPSVDTADPCNLVTQIVVPTVFRSRILEVGHDDILSGHFGVNKTCKRIFRHFYWPGLKKDVKWFVRTCHRCQMVGCPNRKIPKAPLIPIPVVKEPFREILLDLVGPLPKTKSGCIHILTILDRTSRFPEAIPLRSMKADKIVQALVEFFTRYGLPEVVQSDCGTNFTSKVFQNKMKELGIKHVTSSPYHPQSQG